MINKRKKLVLFSKRRERIAPTLDSITIEDASPTNVVMVFDESVTGTNLGFSLSGTTSTVFASISGSGTTWTGVLAAAVAGSETITLSYLESTGDFRDDSGNPLKDITNQSVTNNVIDAPTFDTDYQAILDQATTNGYTLPSAGQQTVQNQLVLDMKSNGVWTEQDIIYVTRNDGSEEFARLNWKSPANFELVKVGTVGWTSNLGFKSVGANGGMNTGWHPAVNGVKYTGGEASASMYISSIHDRATYGEGNLWGGYQYTGSGSKLQLTHYTAGTRRFYGNSISSLSDTNTTDYTGFNTVLRSDLEASNNTRWYLNGAVQSQGDTTLEALNEGGYTWYIGAQNGNSGLSLETNAEWGFFSAGSSLVAKQTILNTLITNYITGL